MKGNPGMGGQGQWSECRADAPGRSTGHNRRSQPIRGGPDLGSPRGLPDHAHHEQTPESGSAVPEAIESRLQAPHKVIPTLFTVS